LGAGAQLRELRFLPRASPNISSISTRIVCDGAHFQKRRTAMSIYFCDKNSDNGSTNALHLMCDELAVPGTKFYRLGKYARAVAETAAH
jgi:hypothetical protein